MERLFLSSSAEVEQGVTDTFDKLLLVVVIVACLVAVIYRIVKIVQWARESEYMLEERYGDKLVFYRRLHYIPYEINYENWQKDSFVISIIIMEAIFSIAIFAFGFLLVSFGEPFANPILVYGITFLVLNFIMFLTLWKFLVGFYYALILPFILIFKK